MKIAVLRCATNRYVYEFICQESESELLNAISNVQLGYEKVVITKNPVLNGKQLGVVAITIDMFSFVELDTIDFDKESETD
jgi:hypothetical protein